MEQAVSSILSGFHTMLDLSTGCSCSAHARHPPSAVCFLRLAMAQTWRPRFRKRVSSWFLNMVLWALKGFVEDVAVTGVGVLLEIHSAV